jgi:hypothetical protein
MIPGMRNHRLPSVHIQPAVLMLDMQRSPQHNRELIELRRLSRLNPARRTSHVRHTYRVRLRIHAPDVFINELGLVPSSLNASGFRDQRRRHKNSLRKKLKVLS